jgi:Protein of unknown function (DUF2961)
MTGYRWHVLDPIPFTKSLRFDIEHLGWTYNQDGSIKSAFGVRDDLMSSVSLWYQDGIATGLPEVPYGSARLPQGNARQFELESVLNAITAEKGQGVGRAGPLLVQGRRPLPGRGTGLEASRPPGPPRGRSRRSRARRRARLVYFAAAITCARPGTSASAWLHCFARFA